jgi:DNA-binding response OmpR family regulator
VLRAGDVELDPARRTATRAGVPLDLTLKEFTVLQVLLEAEGAVVTPEELLDRAWDEQLDPLSNIVRMTVMTLRRKLGDPTVVHTVRGSGYRV